MNSPQPHLKQVIGKRWHGVTCCLSSSCWGDNKRSYQNVTNCGKKTTWHTLTWKKRVPSLKLRVRTLKKKAFCPRRKWIIFQPSFFSMEKLPWLAGKSTIWMKSRDLSYRNMGIFQLATVDASEIPRPTTVWMVLKPVVNNGKKTTNLNWLHGYTPNMEHNSLEVWFRSFSFLLLGDGCRFPAV